MIRIVETDHGGDVIRLDEGAFFIDEHHSVRIPVINDAAVGTVFDSLRFDLMTVLLFKRIWLMRREITVESIIDVMPLFSKKLLDDERRHSR